MSDAIYPNRFVYQMYHSLNVLAGVPSAITGNITNVINADVKKLFIEAYFFNVVATFAATGFALSEDQYVNIIRIVNIPDYLVYTPLLTPANFAIMSQCFFRTEGLLVSAFEIQIPNIAGGIANSFPPMTWAINLNANAPVGGVNAQLFTKIVGSYESFS